MTHRGEIVEKAVRGSGIPLTRIADRLGKSRRWIYNIFETPDLSLDVILEIGKIIHYDFTKEIPQLAPSYFTENPLIYTEQDAEFWKNKYFMLLEEYHELLKRTVADK